jgi:hypothetical protein
VHGNRVPAHATAMGKALLAFSPPALVDEFLRRGLTAFTPFTLTAPTAHRLVRLGVLGERDCTRCRCGRCPGRSDWSRPGTGSAHPISCARRSGLRESR